MRVAAYFIATMSVALCASALGFPTFYKRVAQASRVFACFTRAIATGEWSDECAAAATINVGIVRQISVSDLTIDFTLNDPTTLGLASSSFSATLISISGIDWSVKESAQYVTIMDNGIPIAKYNTSLSPTTVNGGTLTSAVPDTLIKVAPGQEVGFTAFMKSLITQPTHTFALRGTVDGVVHTHGLPLVPESFKVAGVGFEAPVTVKGCANFPNTPFLNQIGLTFDPATGITTLTSRVNLINSSQLVLIFGDVTYQILDKKGGVVGTSVFKNARLNIGDNPITMVTTITSKEVHDALITEGYTLTHQGFEGSSVNPILVGAFMAVKFDMVIPKLSLAA